MVERVAGTKGVGGGELCGGRRLGRIWGFELWWFLVAFERLGGSVRSRGNGWWCWMNGGGSGCDERHRKAAAAEPAGVEEDGYQPPIAG